MQYYVDRSCKEKIDGETFTIGEVSEITGISRDSLRYYEEKDILYPMHDKDNNYRFYSLDDIDTILSIELYRSMNLSMKEIADIWASEDSNDIANILAEKEEEITSKLEELQRYLSNIQKGKAACDRIEKNLNKYSVAPMPAFEVLGEISDFRAYSEYKEFHNRKDELEGYPIFNSIRKMITFSEKGIEDNRILITRNVIPGISVYDNIKQYEKCIYTIVEDTGENGDILEEVSERSLNWARINNFKCKGIVFINPILTTINNRTLKSYLEAYGPIE